MSLFSKFFGKKNRSMADRQLCNWILNRLREKEMSAEEITKHVDTCPICKQGTLKQKERRNPTNAKVNSKNFPTLMVIAIEGPFNLDQILFMARREDKDLIVMGIRSPAFMDQDVLFQLLSKFVKDSNLVLVFEKRPNRFDPLCTDPLVIVRREFLIESARNLNVRTLGELAIKLTIEASKLNLKVSYV